MALEGRRAAAPLTAAVSASYAVPGWYTPVAIGDRTYVDGGVVSPTSADLLIGNDVTEAIVLAPMAARSPFLRACAATRWREALRRHMTRIVDREVRSLERAGILLPPARSASDPSNEDIAAFGTNLMAFAPSPERVFDAATSTAPRAVERALAR